MERGSAMTEKKSREPELDFGKVGRARAAAFLGDRIAKD
jgi:hypothetical protein